MTLMAVISIGVIGGYWLFQEYSDFKRESARMRADYIDRQKNLLKTEVSGIVDYIERKNLGLDDELKLLLQNRVENTHKIAENLYNTFKASKSDPEIIKIISESLRGIRFENGGKYLFLIHDGGETELLSECEKPSANKQLFNIKRRPDIIGEIIHKSQSRDSFFIDLDSAAVSASDNPVKHLLYFQKFNPLSIIIGSGCSTEIVIKQIKEEAVDRIEAIKFGKDGYIFAGDWDGLSLSGPTKGRNMINVTDDNGVKIVLELINAAKSGGGFVEYVMPKYEGTKSAPKLSYVQGIKSWQWYVGSGVYIDEIEDAVARERARVKQTLLNHTISILCLLIALIFFSLALTRKMRRKAESNYNSFTNFFKKAAEESAWIDPDEMDYIEFEELAKSANIMIKGRKAAEDELEASRAYLRATLESTGDGILVVKNSGDVLMYNEKFIKMWNIPDSVMEKGKDDVLIRYVLDQLESPSEFLNRIKELYQTSEICEDSVFLTDGRTFDRYSRPLEKDGVEVGRVWSFRDVTEYQKARMALVQSEALLRAILAASPVGICLLTDHVINWYNNALGDIFGYGQQELLGRHDRVLYLNDQIHQHVEREALKQIDEYGQAVIETVLVKKDGSVIDCALKMKPLSRDQRELTHITVVQDITAQKKADAAMKESERRFRDLFNTISDFIYAHDMEGRLLDVNPSAARSLGYSPGEIIGRKIPDFMRIKNRKAFYDDYLPRIQKVEGPLNGVFVLLGKDGREHYIEYSGVYVNEGDKQPYVNGSGREVTERVLAEREMEKLEEQLFHSQKMEAIGTLASGVAHDFNNVLQVISGYIQSILMESSIDPSLSGKLDKMNEAVERAAELIRRLLTFSRKTDIALKPLDLNEEVMHAVKMLERTIPRMISIETKLSGDLKKVNGESVLLEQVLMNLGSNARDAMPNGGRLVIETENVVIDSVNEALHYGLRQGDYALLKVWDTGKGMDKKTMQRIFEPFFTTKRIGEGTGLGLSTVYGIIKGHNGRITCYSEPGEGTIFKIYIPAAGDVATVEKADIKDQAEALSGSETILLVDDEKPILEVGKSILQQFGYKIATASSGEEALEIYDQPDADIDLVILDLGMPGMGGRACLEKLLRINPEVKVIIASGYSVDGQAQDILDLGAKGFVGKPYRIREMMKSIRAILDLNAPSVNGAVH